MDDYQIRISDATSSPEYIERYNSLICTISEGLDVIIPASQNPTFAAVDIARDITNTYALITKEEYVDLLHHLRSVEQVAEESATIIRVAEAQGWFKVRDVTEDDEAEDDFNLPRDADLSAVSLGLTAIQEHDAKVKKMVEEVASVIDPEELASVGSGVNAQNLERA